MFGSAATIINNDWFVKYVSVWPQPSPGGNSPQEVTVGERAQGASRGGQTRIMSRLRGGWCGPGRAEVASATHSSRYHTGRAAAPSRGRQLSCGEGASVPELYSLYLPHGQPPRAVTAPAKGASAQTGAGSRGLRPRDTAPGPED